MGVQPKFENSEVNLGDTIKAVVTVTNDGDVPAALPKPELWISSVSLRVARESDPAESFIMRIGGEPADLKLKPGESISETLEFPAVEAGDFNLEALYRPTGRIHPQFIDTEVERSAPAALKVRDNGKQLRARLSTEAGEIKLEFYPAKALNHVTSFVTLAKKGYFDGISFHRVVPGFVIQGGDPTGSGSGGPGYRLPAEFNEIKHVPGILSMARTQDPHSAGSQFFVCTADCPNLDSQYTVFGRVIEGLEAVMQIGESEANAGKFHMQKVEILLE